MKTLSRWAFNHQWSARIIIVLCHCILICIALVIGILLDEEGIQLPEIVLTLFSILFLALLLKYPSRQKLAFTMPYTYAHRKLADLGLIVSGFCLIISVTNQTIISEPPAMQVQMTIIPLVYHHPQHEELRHERKELRRKAKQQIRDYIRDTRQGLSKAEAILIGVAFVIAFLISIALIGALSCSIACSGLGALAIMFFLGGLLGSSYFLVIGFRWLIRKRQLGRGEMLPEG